MKKKHLAFIFSGGDLNSILLPHYFFIKKLCIHFDEISIINVEHLRSFRDFTTQTVVSFIEKEDFPIPKNIKIFVPKNKFEFINFMKDKDWLLINNVNRNLADLSIHRLLSLLNVPWLFVVNSTFFCIRMIIAIDF